MARSGIYKSEVIRAREKLMAAGRLPTIDAIRLELGNTGSKTTIQRYVKEIEEDEAGKSKARDVPLSETLQNLIMRLSEQLQDEADQQVLLAKEAHAAELKVAQDALRVAQAEIQSLQQRLTESQKETAAEKGRREELHATFIAETQARNKAEQRASDIQLQLESEVRHREATEAKYADARRSLEHFRDASREQREQAARQHENQVQFLQHELHGLKTSLTQAQLKSAEAFQELARLTTELGTARRDLAQQEKLRGQLQSLSERLATTQGERDMASSQLARERQAHEALQLDLDQEAAQRKVEAARAQGLESELLTMKVRLETSEEIAEQIRLQVSKLVKSAAKRPVSH